MWPEHLVEKKYLKDFNLRKKQAGSLSDGFLSVIVFF